MLAVVLAFEMLLGMGCMARAGEGELGADSAIAIKGLRMFTCGHSFHVFVYRIVGEMAQAARIRDHQNVGISGIGGSRVIQHWDVPEEKNKAKAALRAGGVDVLTLSPIWFPDEGIANFVKFSFEHNPDIRVMVQEFWLPNDTYEPIYPLDARKKVDHNAVDLAALRDGQARYLKDLEACVAGINGEIGKDVALVVPVGQAVLALRETIAAGEAPGLKMHWDLFRDPWGHPQAPVTVLSGYCHFAVIYRRSPVGLPVPQDLAKYRRPIADVSLRRPGWRPTPADIAAAIPLTDEEQRGLNLLLQKIAWEAVMRHPSSGVAARSGGR